MEETTKMEIQEVNEVAEMEKPYTLRKLEAYDVAPVATILTQIGFKEFRGVLNSPEINAFAKALAGNTEENEVREIKMGMHMAFEMVGIILANYSKCQDSLLSWLGSLSGMKKEEIGHLDIDAFAEMLIDVFKKEELKGFMKVVSKLLK